MSRSHVRFYSTFAPGQPSNQQKRETLPEWGIQAENTTNSNQSEDQLNRLLADTGQNNRADYDALTYQPRSPQSSPRVYSDLTLVIQLNGDNTAWETARPDSGVTGRATSSSTQPTLMAWMLETLDVKPGQDVLEVRTGTGYNAAHGYPDRAPYDRILSHVYTELDAGAMVLLRRAADGNWTPPAHARRISRVHRSRQSTTTATP
jgi:hypothetical protein